MAPDDALRPLAPELWVTERPLRALPFLDIGTRMSVIRTADGGLALHSPVPADDATRRAVAALDRVPAWEFDRVVVTHGEMLESGGRDALRQAYPWL